MLRAGGFKMHLLISFLRARHWQRLTKLVLAIIALSPTFFVERDLALVHVYIYYITALLLGITTFRIFFELKKIQKTVYAHQTR